jgi:hypothetical protein
MIIRLNNVRLSFAKGLFEPRALKPGDTPKYSCHFLFPAEHEAMKTVQDAILAEAKAKWPSNWQQVLATLKAADRLCLRDGAVKGATPYAETYKGMFFLSASNAIRPTAVDCVAGPDGKARPLTAVDGKLYSGCYVNAEVDVYALDKKGWDLRACATLMGVQFLRDGPRLSGAGVSAPSAFEAIPDSAAPFGSAEPEGKGVASIFG